MTKQFLFPHHYKKIGWLLFIPSILCVLITSFLDISIDEYLNTKVFAIYSDPIIDKSSFFKIIKNGILDEIITITTILGGLFVGFSKTKNEDEMISKIRYESLVWATYLNYSLIIFFTIFIFGMAYFNVLLHNLFTLLVFFIIRFHYMINKLNTTSDD